MRPITDYTFAPTALDADGICASQTLGGAGDLTINGALASGGTVTLGEQAKVTLYSTANYSAVTFTVYGTTKRGVSISESLAGPNNSTVTTTANFYTITRIASGAALATAIIAGNSNALETPWVRMDPTYPLKGVSVQMTSTGNFTYEVQYATSPLLDSTGAAVAETSILAVADGTLTAKSASAAVAMAANPWYGVRVKITSFSAGGGTLRVVETRG